MAEPLPTVSVVIPTRDRLDVIQRTLAGALEDPATTEVIVMVDHGDEATQGTRTLLDRLVESEPRLRWQRVPPDPGGKWSVQHGRDVGVATATSEVILALDDDVVAEPGMVTGHARAHSSAEHLVVVGYMPVASSEPWPRSNAPIRHYQDAYEWHCKVFRDDPDSILRSLWGGNISVRRADWLVAIERPRTEAWGHDDQELGLLFLRAGLRGRYEPQLRGKHFYRRTLRGFVSRAEMSSVAQARLRRANPGHLSEPEGGSDSLLRRLFAPAEAISRWSAGWFVVKWALVGTIAATGALRLHSIEDAAARYLFFVASQRSLGRSAAPRGG